MARLFSYPSPAHSLTADKMSDETMTKERDKFDVLSIEKLLSDSFKHKDFANDPELKDLGTQSFEPYEDDGRDHLPAPLDNNEVDPDTYNQYVDAKVALPIGDTMMNVRARGR